MILNRYAERLKQGAKAAPKPAPPRAAPKPTPAPEAAAAAAPADGNGAEGASMSAHSRPLARPDQMHLECTWLVSRAAAMVLLAHGTMPDSNRLRDAAVPAPAPGYGHEDAPGCAIFVKDLPLDVTAEKLAEVCSPA